MKYKKEEAMEKNLIKELTEEEYFRLCDGSTLKSLEELKKALSTMPDDTFNYHVNNEKNDFANWISGVFQNENLAEEIRKAKSKKEIIELLEAALKTEDKNLKKNSKQKRKTPQKSKSFKTKPKKNKIINTKPKKILGVRYPKKTMLTKIMEVFKNA